MGSGAKAPAAPAVGYYGSAQGAVISLERAARECWNHGASILDLVTDLGLRDSYDAQEVLSWLGY